MIARIWIFLSFSVLFFTFDSLSAQNVSETPVEKSAQVADAVMDSLTSSVENDSNLFNLLKKGGLMMIPILLCSIFSLAFTIERFVVLRKRTFIPPQFIKEVIQIITTKGLINGINLCEENKSYVARVLRSVLIRDTYERHELQVTVEDECENILWQVNGRTKVLGVISSVSPLLGLMGTVVGMIEAFHVVAAEKGLGQTALLASGIEKALFTTAAGLAVAIPTFLFYHYFKGKAETIVRDIETQAEEFVIGLKTDFRDYFDNGKTDSSDTKSSLDENNDSSGDQRKTEIPAYTPNPEKQ